MPTVIPSEKTNLVNCLALDWQADVAGDLQIYADYWLKGTKHGANHDNGFFAQMAEAVNKWYERVQDGTEGKETQELPDTEYSIVSMLGARIYRAGEKLVVGPSHVKSMYIGTDWNFDVKQLRWSEIVPLEEGEPIHLILNWSNKHADPLLANKSGHGPDGMIFQGIWHPGGFKP
jgi:hypothetical protein